VAGGFERAHMTALRALLEPGAQVVDVGANIGLVTCVLAHAVGPRGRVLAIEPLAVCRAKLELNLARNNLEARVQLLPLCAGARLDEVELHVIDGNEEYAAVGGIAHPSAIGDRRIERCSSDTLDAICARYSVRPALVKVDTEGHEGGVLHGMATLLADARPTLSLELVPDLLRAAGSNLREVLELLAAAHYDLIDLCAQPARVECIGVGAYHQFLALPRERSREGAARVAAAVVTRS